MPESGAGKSGTKKAKIGGAKKGHHQTQSKTVQKLNAAAGISPSSSRGGSKSPAPPASPVPPGIKNLDSQIQKEQVAVSACPISDTVAISKAEPVTEKIANPVTSSAAAAVDENQNEKKADPVAACPVVGSKGTSGDDFFPEMVWDDSFGEVKSSAGGEGAKVQAVEPALNKGVDGKSVPEPGVTQTPQTKQQLIDPSVASKQGESATAATVTNESRLLTPDTPTGRGKKEKSPRRHKNKSPAPTTATQAASTPPPAKKTDVEVKEQDGGKVSTVLEPVVPVTAQPPESLYKETKEESLLQKVTLEQKHETGASTPIVNSGDIVLTPVVTNEGASVPLPSTPPEQVADRELEVKEVVKSEEVTKGKKEAGKKKNKSHGDSRSATPSKAVVVCEASDPVTSSEVHPEKDSLTEIPQVREQISETLGESMTACDSSDATAKVRALEAENKAIKKLIEGLVSRISRLESRVSGLEKSKSAPNSLSPSVARKSAAKNKSPANDDDDDIDLFASDEDDANDAASAVREKRLAEYAAKKSKKPAVVAKSSVVLEVKPWDDETDMNALEKAVRSIQMDGLVWGAAKLTPVAYNINKLSIVCVVEDEKVSIEDLSERIERLHDYVQSVDVASFNKI